jgi:hypothetical protein
MLDKNFSQSLMKLPIDLILVPQGVEYKAVCWGLERAGLKLPVLPIPLGRMAVTQYLQGKNWQEKYPRVLVMGVCGSLSPDYGVGKALLIGNCYYQGEVKEFDRCLTNNLYNYFQGELPIVRGVTSDRLICSVEEKTNLAEKTSAQAVEMEAIAILEAFPQVAMVRVVSDEWNQAMPNLNSAISSTGTIQTFALILAFLRQPIAALRLICGSLRAIKKLELIAADLGKSLVIN